MSGKPKQPVGSDDLFYEWWDRREERDDDGSPLGIAYAAWAARDPEIKVLDEMILDCYRQACLQEDGRCDHMGISTYEAAQRYLLTRGLLKPEECVRP